jgi:cell division GTPase FtsZ
MNGVVMPEFAFPLMDTVNQEASIKVIGIGGGVCNGVSHMVSKVLKCGDFICAISVTKYLRMTK